MDTVSENLVVSIKMDASLTCEKVCHNIQKLIDYCNKNNSYPGDSVLVIRIIPVSDDTSMIPKLELKN